MRLTINFGWGRGAENVNIRRATQDKSSVGLVSTTLQLLRTNHFVPYQIPVQGVFHVTSQTDGDPHILRHVVILEALMEKSQLPGAGPWS